MHTRAPAEGLAGLRETWSADLLSGFLVFLIALPLCLGISMASGFPPIAGILTAIVGGVVTTFFGSAPLTIKGPAAGLIVIALGAVQDLGGGDALLGYRRALATIVVAGLVQVALSRVRAGALGDLFPSSVVHGMLAAIGVIIFAKQVHVMLGVPGVAGEPLELLARIPSSVASMNPEIVVIGALSLMVLFGMPALPWTWAKKIPPPLVVVVIAIALGGSFDLGHEHHYQFQSHDYVVGPSFLVRLPGSLLSAVTLPDFGVILEPTSLRYVVMFALVGSIESLLSAKAIDSLDPLARKSDLDRDLLATGVGNVIAGMIGGLPMISEIVRSSANVSNGARTRFANFFHGLFLLLFVAAAPWLLQRIPLAALAAMLVYTGLRLASPAELSRTWRIGREQMLIFGATLGVTLATDLLIGVLAGIVVKTALHWRNGMPLRNALRPQLDVIEAGEVTTLRVAQAAVFSNFLTIRRHLERVAPGRPVVIDLSSTRIVDHTVMERLHELMDEWNLAGRSLEVIGLDAHERLSAHPLAARRKVMVTA